MIADELQALVARADAHYQRAERYRGALDASEALLAALHEALVQPSPSAISALRKAEQRWADARGLVDNPDKAGHAAV